MTLAAPTPRPPMTRQKVRSHAAKASPEPIALTMNRPAAISMTRTRPSRSASGPANQAPTAQPSRAEETTKPRTTRLRWKVCSQRVDGAVDDRGVVAEQEAADGRRRGHQDGRSGGSVGFEWLPPASSPNPAGQNADEL